MLPDRSESARTRSGSDQNLRRRTNQSVACLRCATPCALSDAYAPYLQGMDTDAAGRSKRLRIIVGIGAAVFLASLAVGVIGNRRVNDEVSRIRANATTAVIDPGDIVMTAYDASSDPVADALGAPWREVVQTDDLAWCVWIEVSHLVSSRSLYFKIEADSTVVEVQSC